MIDFSSLRCKNGQIILNKEEINAITVNCIADFNRDALKAPTPIMADEIAEVHLGYHVRYEHLSHNDSILGTIAFNEGKIPVYDPKREDIKYIKVKAKTMLFDLSLIEPEQRGRAEFSIAHEIGHAVMHPPQIIDYGEPSGIITCRNAAVEPSVDMPSHKRTTPLAWREWQADYFAACLKMPRVTFLSFARECLRKDLGQPAGIIRVTNEETYDIAEALWATAAKFYFTSNQAARIRLQELNVIRDLDQEVYKQIQAIKDSRQNENKE